MSRIFRSVLVLPALLLACISLPTDWFFGRASVADCFDDCVSLLEAQRKKEELIRQTQIAVERLHVKMKIAEELKNGEMSLIDATAYYRALHEDPRSWHDLEHPWPGRKDGEAWYRAVIDWTTQYVACHLSPSQADLLHQRLEAQLQELLKKHSEMALRE